MATEVSDHDDRARGTLSAAFQRWEQLLADGLRRMQDSERLRADALATGLVAALQGGYLLAQSARDGRPMELALDMALDHVRTLLTSWRPRLESNGVDGVQRAGTEPRPRPSKPAGSGQWNVSPVATANGG
jgi:hypothetical protein